MLERELRDLAHVKRWAIVRTLRDQSVAEHSYYVTMYANDIASHLGLDESVQLTILKRALWHDVDEILTGDIPGPHKKKLVDKVKANTFFQSAMGVIFGQRAHRDGQEVGDDPHRTQLVAAILKVADLLEAIHFLEEEATMGNKNVEHLKGPLWEQIQSCCWDIDKLMPHTESGYLYRNLIKTSMSHGTEGKSLGPLAA
jgi:5'-deoxynucleotidase YfbR-like HD superfamily hydrolase